VEITRIPGDGDQEYYQVQDQQSLQGVYYIAVDRSDRKLAVTSIGPDGRPDEADTLLIGTRVGLEGGEEDDGGLSWSFEDDADLSLKLASLLGPHASIVQKDLGVPVDAPGPDGQKDDVDITAPAAVRASDMSFTFDPDVDMSGEETGEEGADGDPDADASGGVAGKLPEPQTGEPEPDELEIP
jgi:hypothetical protein